MAAHSSTLAWKIPWMEEPGGLQFMGLLRVGHDWATSLSLFTFMHWRRKWQPTPVFLPAESQGRGAWWAAVYRVAQSRTQLKWLSSSRLYSPWNSPGQNTEVGSLSLLQEIFSTQGSNPALLHCRQILYQLSHKGSPRILECVAYPFSRGSSQPRNQTGVFCIAGGFFINWAIREAQLKEN